MTGAKGFKRWWFALCLLASAILLVESYLPKWLFSKEDMAFTASIKSDFEQYKRDALTRSNASEQLISKLMETFSSPAFKEATRRFARKLIIAFLALFLVGALLQVWLIIVSKASVTHRSRRRSRREFSRSWLLSLSFVVLTLIKVLPFALGPFAVILTARAMWSLGVSILLLVLLLGPLMFMSLLPGIWLYAKLYFTGYLITETSAAPFAAAAESWRMTRGSLPGILTLIFVGFTVNVIGGITLFLLVPGLAFMASTRAAAYRQLRPLESAASSPDHG